MFYFLLLKTDHFLNFNVFSKKQRREGKFTDKLGKSICKLFHVLNQFVFTKSETELHFITGKSRHELDHELANDLGLMKISVMLGFDGKYPASQPKAKFLSF